MDADGVLADAVEVFKRSAARSRSTDAPADGSMGNMEGGADGSSGSGQEGTAGDGDLDDLTRGDLDDMIAGGGQLPSEGTAEGEAPGGEAGSAGNAEGAGEGAGEGAQQGPWHQPGAAGSGRDPTSEEVYGQGGQGGQGSQEGKEGESADGASGTASAEERHAELERVLAEAMGDFDGRILDERAVIIAQRGNNPGSVDGPSAGEGEGEGQGSGTAGSGTGRDPAGRRPAPAPPAPGTPQTGRGNSRGSVGGGAVPSQTAEADIPIPEDVGDGANDDVVARQLREAAMNERDPELREKLWEEYRRYVAGRR